MRVRADLVSWYCMGRSLVLPEPGAGERVIESGPRCAAVLDDRRAARLHHMSGRRRARLATVDPDSPDDLDAADSQTGRPVTLTPR